MDITAKIKQPENRKLEFKEKLPQGPALLKIVSAFANGAGGELIIGVTDRERHIVGVDDPLSLEEQIMNRVHDGIYPPVSPFCSIIRIGEKNLLSIQILSGSNKPYYIKSKGVEKGTFIRIGSTNRQADSEIIHELKRRIKGLSFVDEIDFYHQNITLDNKSLQYFAEAVGMGKMNEDMLVKCNILRKNNGDNFPTVAAMILFGPADHPAYEYAGIRLTRFSGSTFQNVMETRTYAIPLVQKVDQLCTDIVALLPKESVFEGARRLERPIIPFVAIRESVINAIVHRDYSIKGSSIKISIFDDRIEVISPGVLAGNMDISDLGKGLSETRNRTLVRVFRQLGLMEELGTGIARMITAYKERALQPPVFLEQGQFFKVILPQQKEMMDIPDAILNFLYSQGSLNAAQLARETGMHHNTVLKHLKKLINERKVRKKGAGRNITYQISES